MHVKNKLVKAVTLLLATLCLLNGSVVSVFAAEQDSKTVIVSELADHFDLVAPHVGDNAAADATNYNYRVDTPVVGERIPLIMDMPVGVEYIFWYETDDYGTYQRLNPNYTAVYDAGRSYILVIVTSSSAYSVTVNGKKADRIDGTTIYYFDMGQPRTRSSGTGFWQTVLNFFYGVYRFLTYPIRWLFGL